MFLSMTMRNRWEGARGNALSEAASSSPPAPRASCVYLILFGSSFAGLGFLGNKGAPLLGDRTPAVFRRSRLLLP